MVAGEAGSSSRQSLPVLWLCNWIWLVQNERGFTSFEKLDKMSNIKIATKTKQVRKNRRAIAYYNGSTGADYVLAR
jgi:hypothetical protein